MPTSPLKPGDRVLRIGNLHTEGIVETEPRMIHGELRCQVQFLKAGSEPTIVRVSELQPVSAPSFTWASKDEFLAHLGVQKITSPTSDILLSLGWSRTEFLPHQFTPAVQFLRGDHHGILVADEVGLGKTIEAAIILRELMARGDLPRILIVCPANLRQKWHDELLLRFDLDFDLLRGHELLQRIAEGEQLGVMPRLRAIVSYESIRNKKVHDALLDTALHFNCVIADEAHHMRNPSTFTSRMGEFLADRTDAMILLSATPLQTGETDLLTLLRLVEPSKFQQLNLEDLNAMLEPNLHINLALSEVAKQAHDPHAVSEAIRKALNTDYGRELGHGSVLDHWIKQLATTRSLSPERVISLRRDLKAAHTIAPHYTRTRKREVQKSAERAARTYNVALNTEEQACYDALLDYLVARYWNDSGERPPSFAIIQRERMAASCLRAAIQRLTDTDGEEIGYEGLDEEVKEVNRLGEPTAWDGTANQESSVTLDQAKNRLNRAIVALPTQDTKKEAFLKLVRELLAAKSGRKIIVFTTFVGTLEFLSDCLEEAGVGYESISGKVDVSKRPGVIQRFRDDQSTSVLLSTEVGSEGIDLQFCDAIINYDLPWNPMRVEQRIGRIDRYGQQSDSVTVASFSVSSTIDSRIVERLYTRIGIFEQSIGELEPILRSEIRDLQRVMLTGQLTSELQEQQAHERLLRIEEKRRQMADLEEAEGVLIGHGALLREEIKSQRSTGRFLSSTEAEAIVRTWLDQQGNTGGELEGTRWEDVLRLRLMPLSVDEVRKSAAEKLEPAVEQLLFESQSRQGVRVTFSQEVAREKPELPFLHIAHPVVQAATKKLSERPRLGWLGRVGSFVMPKSVARDLPPVAATVGALLAVYRLTIHSVALPGGEETRVIPVAVAASERATPLENDLAERLMGAIASAEELTLPHDEPAWIDMAITAIEEPAHARSDEVENDLKSEHQLRIDQQRAAITKHLHRKIRNAQRLESSATNEGIRRLRAGEIRKFKNDLEVGLEPLRNPQPPSAGLEEIALAYFVPPGLARLIGREPPTATDTTRV